MPLRRRTLALGLALATSIVAIAIVLRGGAGEGAGRERALDPPRAGAGAAPATGAPPIAVGWELPLPSPAAGWEEAAETVALDLRRFLVGRPAGGAYEEARAEAARADLALFPPEPARLRRLLLSPSPSDRSLALAALSTRGAAPDELVSVALRSARAEDDDLVRLLAAELAAALPPEQLARHEDDLLLAFEREPNPLVLAVALPALERLEAPRLRALLEAQLGVAAPEMIPVLAALARDRLGAEELRSVGVSVFGPADAAWE